MADRYEVTDTRTARVVRVFTDRDAAYDFADAADARFGAVCYTVRPVWNA